MTAIRKPTITTAGLSTEMAKALEPVKQSVEMITGARAGFEEIKGLPQNTSASALMAKINEICARINASGSYTLQKNTAKAPLSDAGVQPEDLKFLPLTGGTLTGALAVNSTVYVTNPSYATGYVRIYVDGEGGTIVMRNQNSGGHLWHLDTWNDQFRFVYDGNSVPVYMTSAGFFASAGTFSGALKGQTVQATSDKRLKKRIKKYNADISSLHAKSYWFKKGDDKQHVGLIAQEVEKVLPQAVSEDDKGNLSLDYNAVVAVLVNKVNELERRLVCLTNTLSRLQRQ